MKIGRVLGTMWSLCSILTLACIKTPSSPSLLTDAEAVAADKSELTISYMSGDSAPRVTRNIRLPDSGTHGCRISWASNNGKRISTTGIVSRPGAGSGDTIVTLTATISRGEASDLRDFVLTVREILSAGTVTDIDGNVYHTVVIGDQIWTTENLRTTRYNDGSPIVLDTADTNWGRDTVGKYCLYFNRDSLCPKFGALYNWYAVATGKLAPAGWHVPDTAEWNRMRSYLIANGFNWDGSITENKFARSLAAESDWGFYSILGTIGRDLSVNNRSGFTALPAGTRYIDRFEENMGYDTYWWTTDSHDSSDAYCRYLLGNSIGLNDRHYDKLCGFSVRLVKN